MKASISRGRSTGLIATFEHGFAVGWHMAVRECFKEELDIKLTDRKKDRQSCREWTQGPYFCFSEGQVLYDSKQAYSNWHNALANMNIACQIVEAKPNMPAKFVNEITGKNNFSISEGYVKFVLFKPNAKRNKLAGVAEYHMTQNQFVKFLQYGELEQTNSSMPEKNNG
jgi:hypothetical protein